MHSVTYIDFFRFSFVIYFFFHGSEIDFSSLSPDTREMNASWNTPGDEMKAFHPDIFYVTKIYGLWMMKSLKSSFIRRENIDKSEYGKVIVLSKDF